VRLGESWPRGPVILSWAHSESGALNDTDGHNVVIHEFAHQIDDLSRQPENAAALTNFAGYTAGVTGTEPYLDSQLKGALELNPPAGAAPATFVPPCSPDVVRLYDRIWTNLLK
jgi:spermidine/putrescine-binding protein